MMRLWAVGKYKVAKIDVGLVVRDFPDNPAATLTSAKKKKRAGASEDASASDEGWRDKEADNRVCRGESGGDAKPDVYKVAATTLAGCVGEGCFFS